MTNLIEVKIAGESKSVRQAVYRAALLAWQITMTTTRPERHCWANVCVYDDNQKFETWCYHMMIVYLLFTLTLLFVI